MRQLTLKVKFLSESQVDEESPVKNTLRMVEGAMEAFPPPEDGTRHKSPVIY